MSNSIALIPVFTGTLADRTVQLCCARALHDFMQVRRDFTTWIKGRIRKFGFTANEDYLLTKSGEQVPHQGGTRTVERIDYHLTLDMAKELSMVENNEQGRAARRYFISCERQALAVAQPTPYTVQPSDTLNEAQQIALRAMLESNVKRLPHAQQAGAMKQGWGKLFSHFKVPYRQIPASEFTEAISILSRHVAQWEVVDEAPYQPVNPLNAPELTAARKVAEEYFDNFREAVKAGKPNPSMGEIPQDVLHGMVSRAVIAQRTLSWFDWQTGRMCCKLVESDASVFSLTSGDYNDLMDRVPMERVPEMLEAINRRVASHIGAFSDHLKRNRKHPVSGGISMTGVIRA